jgi:hypothetical protein
MFVRPAIRFQFHGPFKKSKLVRHAAWSYKVKGCAISIEFVSRGGQRAAAAAFLPSEEEHTIVKAFCILESDLPRLILPLDRPGVVTMAL